MTHSSANCATPFASRFARLHQVCEPYPLWPAGYSYLRPHRVRCSGTPIKCCPAGGLLRLIGFPKWGSVPRKNSSNAK